MYQLAFVVACECVCVHMCTAAEYALPLGSLAPKFSPDKVIRGSEKTSLQRGHKYVIEFSGTSCVPCINAIPLIEKLKQKYKEFTFITVFSEPEEDVREFLNGPGARMSNLVACDFNGAIARDWLLAAGRPGIPSIFVVDDDSKIVWMGSPEKLAAVLATIAKDGTPSKEQVVLVGLEQHAAARERAVKERRNEAERYQSEHIFKLINQGQHSEAVKALDQAMETYRDLPDIVDEFRTRKFCEMAYVPGTRDAAYSLALDLAADSAEFADLPAGSNDEIVAVIC